MKRTHFGGSLLAGVLATVVSISLANHSAQADPQPIDPEPITVEQCIENAENWHAGQVIDQIDWYNDWVAQINADHQDDLDDALQTYTDTVANCLDFWCISDALDQYNADVAIADAVRDMLLQSASDILQDLLDALAEELQRRIAACNGGLA